jgi:hypothetical protein
MDEPCKYSVDCDSTRDGHCTTAGVRRLVALTNRRDVPLAASRCGIAPKLVVEVGYNPAGISPAACDWHWAVRSAEPSPGADVGGVSPVPVQMWAV